MHKLDTNEAAALSGDIIDKIAAQHDITQEALVAQMVIRTVSSAGAVYVDDKESPTKLVYLLLGTYGILGDSACVVMAAEGSDTKILYAAAKQFAKEHTCKHIVLGDFTGENSLSMKEHMGDPTRVEIYTQKV